MADCPTVSAEAVAMSKDLVRRGFIFIGPTICYAFMQAAGMVNDHLVRCFRYLELAQGIVKLRLTAASDAQYGGFTTGSGPVSWGSIDSLFANLTIPSTACRAPRSRMPDMPPNCSSIARCIKLQPPALPREPE